MDCSESLGTDPALTRQDVLAAIDSEIASIQKEQAAPGWTNWTFYGCFATLVWLSVTEIATGKFAPVNVLLLFVACSVLIDTLEQTLNMAKPRTLKKGAANRVRLFSQELGATRLSLLGFQLRLLALFGAYFYLHSSVAGFSSLWFLGFYGFTFLVVLLMLILSFFGLPIGTSKALSKRLNGLLNLAFFFGLAKTVWDISGFALTNRGVFTVSDYRIGLLVTVLLWLVPTWLAHQFQNQPLLETLKNLRRDLAFGRIDANAALRQADIALDGMKVDDYLQAELQKLLSHFDAASKCVHRLAERKRETVRLVQAWEAAPPSTEQGFDPAKVLRGMLESFQPHQTALNESIDRAQAVFAEYSKRKKYVEYLIPSSEMARIDSKVTAFFQTLKEQIASMKGDAKLLADSLVRLAAKAPNLLLKAPPTSQSLGS
jgi:hypothetical protein